MPTDFRLNAPLRGETPGRTDPSPRPDIKKPPVQHKRPRKIKNNQQITNDHDNLKKRYSPQLSARDDTFQKNHNFRQTMHGLQIFRRQLHNALYYPSHTLHHTFHCQVFHPKSDNIPL